MTNNKHNQIVKNIFTSFISWGWPVLLSFTVTPIVLRYLGTDGYGIRGIILTVSGYFALFDLGLNGAGTKYLAEFNSKNDNKSIEELLSTTRIVYGGMGLLGLIIIYLLSPWLCESVFNVPKNMIGESIIAFRLSGVGFFLGMFTWWLTSIPTGLQRYDIFNSVSIVYGTMNIIGNLIAAYLGYGIIGIVVSNIISNTIAIIIYLYYIQKLLPQIRISLNFSIPMFKQTMSFGLYMIGFSIFAIIFGQLDKTLIGIFLTTSLLTYYIVPLSISNINQQINGKILQVMFPLSAELMAKNEIEKLKQLYYRSLSMSTIVGLSVSIPLIAFSYSILKLWISAEMANYSSNVFIILVISFLLAGLVPYNIITGMGHAKYYTYSSLVSGVSGMILFSFLIKPFGIMGIASGRFFSIILTVLYYLYISKTNLGIKYATCFKTVIFPFLTAAVFTIAGLFMNKLIGNFITLLAFSCCISGLFILTIWVTNQVGKDDKTLILGFLRIKPKYLS